MDHLNVPQDKLLTSVQEKILDRQWVFLHSDDVKALIRTGNVSPLKDGFSLFWEETDDTLYLQPMSEAWLFCKKIYVNNRSTLSASTPKTFALLRVDEE